MFKSLVNLKTTKKIERRCVYVCVYICVSPLVDPILVKEIPGMRIQEPVELRRPCHAMMVWHATFQSF